MIGGFLYLVIIVGVDVGTDHGGDFAREWKSRCEKRPHLQFLMDPQPLKYVVHRRCT
jgi:hypothetical protein